MVLKSKCGGGVEVRVEVVLKSKSGGGVEVKEWRWC